MITWRKSRRSQQTASCVELANTLTHIRDSKNTNGPTLHGDITALVRAIKAGQLDR
jgi:hypothetical protein